MLSGFVLTKSLERPSSGGYGGYVTRRFFRIWVPFAAVILCAGFACWATHPRPIGGQHWVDAVWNVPLTLALLAGHLLMVGIAPYETLDSSMWTRGRDDLMNTRRATRRNDERSRPSSARPCTDRAARASIGT